MIKLLQVILCYSEHHNEKEEIDNANERERTIRVTSLRQKREINDHLEWCLFLETLPLLLSLDHLLAVSGGNPNIWRQSQASGSVAGEVWKAEVGSFLLLELHLFHEKGSKVIIRESRGSI